MQKKNDTPNLNHAARGAGDVISERLRQYYDSVCEEAIPDKFLDLLERLDQADRASGTVGSNLKESGAR